ncbi:class I SAM-dependent methyltransferase [Treponema sp. OttesenSCG-928-L16]|nr:class I SAM-dependent methyltransferase [Treponema sp. OttesenSCG-928-L16]
MQNPPRVYETTGIAFWDDEHISKSMLNAHLVPDSDGASRNHAFINKSAEWISSLPAPGRRLLDLGCGPGLYAEAFCRRGYQVSGIDFSKRSIEYARQSALRAGLNIDYAYQDYLTINFRNEFDIAVLIYCDFGVLAPGVRKSLLEKVHAAMKPGGLFLVDAFTPRQYRDFTDKISATFEEAGFWRPKPYICIKREKRYEAEHFLEQYVVITEDEQQTYNLWNHAFSQEELGHDLESAGFADIEYYGDVSGGPLANQNSTTICAVCKKL